MGACRSLRHLRPGILLALIVLAKQGAAAPLADNEGSTEIEYYPVADATGCYYNFQHYDEGDRIITNEPCLNCTCHNKMLMCYLRVCPFTKAVGANCKVEKRNDTCCPVITCPEVPVALVPSSTPSTALGHPDRYGCSIDNLFYGDGARVPSNPNNPCELCYCIRNKTACVMQECTLNIEGCKPVYQEGVCCPVKYDCDHPEQNLLEDSSTTTTTTTTTLAPTTTMAPNQCVFNNEIYADGELVKKDIPCEQCYCMKGDIVCAVQECGPTPLDKVNCTALPRKEGQCCTEAYDCDNIIEENLTTIYPQPELTTEIGVTEAATPVIEERDHFSTEKEEITTIAGQEEEEVATTKSTPVETELPEGPFPTHPSEISTDKPVEETTEAVTEAQPTEKTVEEEPTKPSQEEDEQKVVTEVSPVTEKETGVEEGLDKEPTEHVPPYKSTTTESAETTPEVTERVETTEPTDIEATTEAKKSELPTEEETGETKPGCETPDCGEQLTPEQPSDCSSPDCEDKNVTEAVPDCSGEDCQKPAEVEHEVTTVGSKIEEGVTTEAVEAETEKGCEGESCGENVVPGKDTAEPTPDCETPDCQVQKETEAPVIPSCSGTECEPVPVTEVSQPEACAGEECKEVITEAPQPEACAGEECKEVVTEVPQPEACAGEECKEVATEVPQPEACAGEECKEVVTEVPQPEACAGEGCKEGEGVKDLEPSATAQPEPVTEYAVTTPKVTSDVTDNEIATTVDANAVTEKQVPSETEQPAVPESSETPCAGPECQEKPVESTEGSIQTSTEGKPTESVISPEVTTQKLETVTEAVTEAHTEQEEKQDHTEPSEKQPEVSEATTLPSSLKESDIPKETEPQPEQPKEPSEVPPTAVPEATEAPVEKETVKPTVSEVLTTTEAEEEVMVVTEGHTKETEKPISDDHVLDTTHKPEPPLATEAETESEVAATESSPKDSELTTVKVSEETTEAQEPVPEDKGKLPEEDLSEQAKPTGEPVTEQPIVPSCSGEQCQLPPKEGEEHPVEKPVEVTPEAEVTTSKIAEEATTIAAEEATTVAAESSTEKVHEPSTVDLEESEKYPTEKSTAPEAEEITTVPEVESTTVPREEEEHGIPGEGSCLVDGQTYKNNSKVPPINHCQTSCKCVSSILQCDTVNCTPPPANMQNCMPIYSGPDSCCPTYTCAGQEVTTEEPEVQTTRQPEVPTTESNAIPESPESPESPEFTTKITLDERGQFSTDKPASGEEVTEEVQHTTLKEEPEPETTKKDELDESENEVEQEVTTSRTETEVTPSKEPVEAVTELETEKAATVEPTEEPKTPEAHPTEPSEEETKPSKEPTTQSVEAVTSATETPAEESTATQKPDSIPSNTELPSTDLKEPITEPSIETKQPEYNESSTQLPEEGSQSSTEYEPKEFTTVSSGPSESFPASGDVSTNEIATSEQDLTSPSHSTEPEQPVTEPESPEKSSTEPEPETVSEKESEPQQPVTDAVPPTVESVTEAEVKPQEPVTEPQVTEHVTQPEETSTQPETKPIVEPVEAETEPSLVTSGADVTSPTIESEDHVTEQHTTPSETVTDQPKTPSETVTEQPKTPSETVTEQHTTPSETVTEQPSKPEEPVTEAEHKPEVTVEDQEPSQPETKPDESTESVKLTTVESVVPEVTTEGVQPEAPVTSEPEQDTDRVPVTDTQAVESETPAVTKSETLTTETTPIQTEKPAEEEKEQQPTTEAEVHPEEHTTKAEVPVTEHIDKEEIPSKPEEEPTTEVEEQEEVATAEPEVLPTEATKEEEPVTEAHPVETSSVEQTTEKIEEPITASSPIINVTDMVTELFTSGSTELPSTRRPIPGEHSTSVTQLPTTLGPDQRPAEEVPDYQSPAEDYEDEDQGAFGPGTCRYGGKVYVSAQQIPRDDPCDFCFCFRSDIICLQQSCPPPIPKCHEEPIRGFCCPRYECPVSMATSINVTTSTTTTTTTLPPHFLSHAYKGRASKTGCQIEGKAYTVGETIQSASGPCLHCTCGGDGQMKCDPKACTPEPMLRQMMAVAASRRRR